MTCYVKETLILSFIVKACNMKEKEKNIDVNFEL